MLVPDVPDVDEQESALSPCGCHPPPRFEHRDAPLLSEVDDSLPLRRAGRTPSKRLTLLVGLYCVPKPCQRAVAWARTNNEATMRRRVTGPSVIREKLDFGLQQTGKLRICYLFAGALCAWVFSAARTAALTDSICVPQQKIT
mmetsp:Transcript_18068/g.36523  ORF Transcript_18068/g.36523 Transcript_18068/m.36523 type:complete len:143 (+) Transcript_18068:289-717(+)